MYSEDTVWVYTSLLFAAVTQLRNNISYHNKNSEYFLNLQIGQYYPNTLYHQDLRLAIVCHVSLYEISPFLASVSTGDRVCATQGTLHTILPAL